MKRFVSSLIKRKKRTFGILGIVLCICYFYLLSKSQQLAVTAIDSIVEQEIIDVQYSDTATKSFSEIPSMKEAVAEKSYMEKKTFSSNVPQPFYNVHAFYYPWYGSPQFDKEWIHWNHQYLPHWRKEIAKQYPTGHHKPPDDIASDFYPRLGPYSSADPSVVEEHMRQLSFAKIGVIAVSYYPPGMSDDNGKDWQHLFPLILDSAIKYKIKVAFHIEPYKNRNEISVKHDIHHIINTYGAHQSFYRFSYNDKHLPLIYIYDSYHTKPHDWAKILKKGPDSIRNTSYDALVIGLVVSRDNLDDMVVSGFDGFYTYFAADGFTFGSTRQNWHYLNKYATEHNLIFIPSVGPGYVDTRVRPWNSKNTRKRLNGKYFEESWSRALENNPTIISITSFNEWHEGTQIELANPKQIESFKYLDYEPNSAEFYLILVKINIEKFQKLLEGN